MEWKQNLRFESGGLVAVEASLALADGPTAGLEVTLLVVQEVLALRAVDVVGVVVVRRVQLRTGVEKDSLVQREEIVETVVGALFNKD